MPDALPWSSVALAAAFVLAAGAVSLALRLSLERSLALGVVRATLQLSAVGFALKWLFAQEAFVWTAAAMNSLMPSAL